MKVPDNPDDHEELKNEFPHFHVFCQLQLGRTMPYAGVHWENAHVIAKVPESMIRSLTWDEATSLGFT